MSLAKINNEYAKLERTNEGKIFKFSSYRSIEKALAEGSFDNSFSNLQALRDNGWELLPLTYETLTVGDRLVDGDGYEHIMAGASGYGPWRTYHMVRLYPDGIWGTFSFYTASQLENYGFKILPWEDEELTEDEKSAIKLLSKNYEIKKK